MNHDERKKYKRVVCGAMMTYGEWSAWKMHSTNDYLDINDMLIENTSALHIELDYRSFVRTNWTFSLFNPKW